MSASRVVPEDPLAFIRRCVEERRIRWTYHVNMRMEGRYISRTMILESVSSFEIIESYPEDKYLPSYLVYCDHGGEVFHALFATDVADDHVRIVTAYRPSSDEWEEDKRTRRSKR